MKHHSFVTIGIATLIFLSCIINADSNHNNDIIKQNNHGCSSFNHNPCSNHNSCSPHKKKKKAYDYIIIGGGAAGCIEARKLSDNHRKSVLLLEAGGNFIDDPEVLAPSFGANAADLLYNPKYAIVYPTFSQGLHPYSEGHTFGGGAAHNNLLVVRGTPSIYDGWAAVTGNPRWSYFGNIVNLMKQLETYTPTGTVANPAERGFFGPISVLQGAKVNPGAFPFLDQLSVQTLTPFVDDYNNPPSGDIGISAVQQFITPNPGSHRSFSALDFLGDVINKKGKGLNGRKLTVIFNAQALDFNINKKMQATSVHYIAKNKEQNENEFEVKKARLKEGTGILILAAGSVQTPRLLINSGVGPAAELDSVGIPLVLDSPNVGQNLQCQYGSSAVITGGTIPPIGEEFITGYPFMPNDGIRRIQLIDIPQGPNQFQILPSILDPQSRGSVTAVSNNPILIPLVDVAVFTDGPVSTPGTDAYLQVSFFKIVKAAATAAGQTVIFPTPAQYANDTTLLAAARTSITLQSHIVGTARMGTDISNGVVDGNLKVFGLKNVYIGDNSIQPKTTNGNTCYPAYVIALVLCQVLGVKTPPIL